MQRKLGKAGARVVALALIAVLCTATNALAAVNSAVFDLRIFNDDPLSTLVPADAYPASVAISDTPSPASAGFANFHRWMVSEDDSAAAQFENNNAFSFSSDLTISGAGEGEAGLQIRPWWSNTDGLFNFRTTDGEIAVFGGRLPFYSFTAAPHNITYVKGTTVRAGVVYDPNSLSMADPATIEYSVTIGATTYSSGPLAFDQGNPGEDPPHGQWGLLNTFEVGGQMKMFINQNPTRGNVTTTWGDINFVPEPASLALLGLGALTLLRRRR